MVNGACTSAVEPKRMKSLSSIKKFDFPHSMSLNMSWPLTDAVLPNRSLAGLLEASDAHDSCRNERERQIKRSDPIGRKTLLSGSRHNNADSLYEIISKEHANRSRKPCIVTFMVQKVYQLHPKDSNNILCMRCKDALRENNHPVLHPFSPSKPSGYTGTANTHPNSLSNTHDTASPYPTPASLPCALSPATPPPASNP